MLINICVGKNKQLDFPEIAKVEVESVDKFILSKDFNDMINKHIEELLISEKKDLLRVAVRGGGYSVIRTIFVEKDLNLFVWIG